MLHIPVVQKGGKLAGMISYLNLLEATVKHKMVPDETEVDGIMNARVLTATGNTTLHELISRNGHGSH